MPEKANLEQEVIADRHKEVIGSYSATVTLPEESRVILLKAISDVKTVEEANQKLNEEIEDIKTRVHRATSEAAKVIAATGYEFKDEQDRFIAELSNSIPRKLEEGQTSIQDFSIVREDGSYDFTDSLILVQSSMQSSDFPRLNLLTEPKLHSYNPATGEVELVDTIHYGDDSSQDPELYTSFKLDLNDQRTQQTVTCEIYKA